MTLPTQNAVPSSAKNDQLFNAEKIDQVVNSDDLQYTDRFGKKRFTFSGLYDVIQTWLTGLGGSTGASGIGIKQGGTVQNGIISVYVDAFGADPTGSKDSTLAVKKALAQASGLSVSALVSNYSTGVNIRAELVFGNGSYLVGDIPFISGITFRGFGESNTRLIPLPGAGYIFTSVGTVSSGTDKTKRLAYCGVRDMSLGCGIWDQAVGTIPTGVGGMYIKAGTYVKMHNVSIAYLDGNGLRIEEGWDSDFYNVKITQCGNIRTVGSYLAGLHISSISGGVDVSNALRFVGCHLENNPQNLYLGPNSRHIYFNGGKIESSQVSVRVSSVISAVRGCSFNNVELTWQYQDVPMFDIPVTDGSHFGLAFNDPIIISSTDTMGWYFRHLSEQIPMRISSATGFAIWKLISGKNFKVTNSEIMNCGPCLIDATSDVTLIGNSVIASVATVGGNGTDDLIIVNGGNVLIVENNIYSAGTVTDGSAVINLGAATVNPIIKNNVLRGTKNIGIRVNAAATIAPNALIDNSFSATYGGQVVGYSTRYSVTSKTKNGGLGDGSVDSQPVISIAAAGSATLNKIAGGCFIIVKTVSQTDSTVVTDALLFTDYNSTALNLLTSINGIKVGTGAAGDGYVYLTKSGTGLTITNNTTSAINLFISFISAQA